MDEAVDIDTMEFRAIGTTTGMLTNMSETRSHRGKCNQPI